MAADQVFTDDPLRWRSFAVPLDESRFDLGDFAGSQSIAAIKDLPSVSNYGVEQAVDLDVFGKFLEFRLTEFGEQEAGGVETVAGAGGGGTLLGSRCLLPGRTIAGDRHDLVLGILIQGWWYDYG